MDASPLGFPRGTTPLIDLPAVVLLPHRLEGVPQASLSTGANVVSGSGYDAVEADMVDMETFAVMRACHVFGVPLIALRGISDGAKELGHLGDWTEYLHVVDENLAAALLLVKRALHEGLLR
jgi:adenosylhomocysteine nucleosidase